ncbi:MAG TPA: peptide chain release factor N(5)-glutamine methyltransferase, partial [Casimicrobiaceae bacterium]|nr:peptide chain release factor N(5)-glutamine methyltransferase [Casimicrobiaceae bacterium]
MNARSDASITVRQALVQSGLVPLDAQVLLAHALNVDRAWLAAHATDPLDVDVAQRFFELARRRREGHPVAHLTGRREFWSLDLCVTPDVLIPRPETEALVECALARLPKDRALRVLDLCTGSGAIALALARERPNARITASDASAAALVVARENAQRLGVANVAFVESNWYAALAPERYDMIVSNPPYIAQNDPHLCEGDVRFEPRSALVSGPDGLDALRIIVADAPQRLMAGGWLIVEHGYDQADAVRALFAGAGLEDIAS